jgi:hypothetical protein
MPNNYVLLERIELNASAASVTFANIPQTGYTDLKVVVSAKLDYNAVVASLGVHLNSPASDTSYRWLRGNGSVAASGNDTAQQDFYVGEIPALTATANTFSNTEVYIPNYTGSQQKSMSADGVGEQNGTTAYAYFSAGLSTKTAAINSVTVRGFAGSSGNLVSGSTFSLYGLAALGTTPTIAPKASGGNRIDYDGTYWIHTFNTNGTFTPQIGLTCDVLVVAGGGSGGSGGSTYASGGGGGAGGYRYITSNSFASSFTVTVGAGGAAVGAYVSPGSKGTDSVCNTITASGGGGGTGWSGSKSTSGGSGGGGAGYTSVTNGTIGIAGNAGGYSPVEGYAGGNGGSNGDQGGGTAVNSTAAGGGGSSAVGANGSNATQGTGAGSAGGAGTANSITGSSVTYAGGGAGGGNGGAGASGGAGGGGNSNSGNANGNAATVNTGGGGGGASAGASGGGTTGGAGGSGIVIIRYLA